MAQMCREFSSQLSRQDGKDSAVPAVIGNSLLPGFGVDTGVAAVAIADHPKSRIYIDNLVKSRYVAMTMKPMLAIWTWDATIA